MEEATKNLSEKRTIIKRQKIEEKNNQEGKEEKNENVTESFSGD